MTNDHTKADEAVGPMLPRRLHHNAYVVDDQERTRQFYEDVLGLPLRATWIEISNNLKGEAYCHSFYGLKDGGALAFFTFANPEIQNKVRAGAQNLYHHIALEVDEATQKAVRARCKAAGVEARDIDHGYCQSLYVVDPDGMRVEFTVDAPELEAINDYQARSARETLKGWQSGRRSPNNDWRAHL